MSAAVQERLRAHARVATADVQGANALGTIHFVGGQAQQVDAHVVDIERQLAGSLNGIGVEEHAVALTQGANLLDRLQGANFVIGGHHADQDRPVSECAGHLLDGYPAKGVHRQERERKALALEPAAGIEHRMVLRHGGDEVVALSAVHCRDSHIPGRAHARGTLCTEEA